MCNLDCTYCYYLSKGDLLGKPDHWAMSEETLEAFIRQYFDANNHEEVVFSWQGGEPTLLGVDFFRKVVALQKQFCPEGARCENDLQTNGTLLDDDWCHFLYEHNFLVGLSIDGPQGLHDEYRKDLGRIYVNYFETAVETWMGHVAPMCTLAPMCGKGLACERDGSVYACDHYVYPEYRIGNITEKPLAEMAFSAPARRTGSSAREAASPA